MSILAFDLGIRNLAYCMVDASGSILDWNNYDLLAGTDSQTASRCNCGGPISWTDLSGNLYCKKCVKSKGLVVYPIKDTALRGLKELALKEAWVLDKGTKAKKEDYIAYAYSKYLMPYVKPKGATKTDLGIILDSINVFLNSRLSLFSKCVSVRIENQPVLTNPTMKSVQMILYTLLVHRLKTEFAWSGKISFVHASKKTEEEQTAVDKEGGDYKARKNVAEAMVIKKLQGSSPWLTFFQSKTKRSDLADCYLMCLR